MSHNPFQSRFTNDACEEPRSIIVVKMPCGLLALEVRLFGARLRRALTLLKLSISAVLGKGTRASKSGDNGKMMSIVIASESWLRELKTGERERERCQR